MKRALIALAVLALAAKSTMAHGEPVRRQIYFTKKVNLAVHETYSLRFSLWTDPVATDEAAYMIWFEEKLVVLPTRNLKTYLGSVNPLPDDFSQQYWVQVDARMGLLWEPLGRRNRLNIAPYALWSGSVTGDITSVAAGPGLLGGGIEGSVSLQADFGGTGTAITVSRSDHSHAGYADKSHSHSGGDITTGIVGETLIPSIIARDSEVVPLVLAGDGSGSGLDSDTVDGLHASQIAMPPHNHDDLYYGRAYVDALRALVASQEARITALETLLAGVTRVSGDIYITGANLHIRSGSGETDGIVNGKGNLIVGYNEPRTWEASDHTGSHNIVVGPYHNFGSYGGIVVGSTNTISNAFASVSGGRENIASGQYASVSGGGYGHATGDLSSIGGGYYNTASGGYSSVNGGTQNVASGAWSSVSGGGGNTAGYNGSSVSGGHGNTAIGSNASVSAGAYNIARGENSSVSGGWGNTASGYSASVSGGGGGDGQGNEAYADYSSVLGGTYNVTGDKVTRNVGQSSTISGGEGNNTSGYAAAISGGQDNTASGRLSSVSGGGRNTASGGGSSISGGGDNTASGEISSVSAGAGNIASGWISSISGGQNNIASGFASSVSGGGGAGAIDGNEAYADYSSILGGTQNVTGDKVTRTEGLLSVISGGRNNTTSGYAASVSGGCYNTASGGNSSVSGGYYNTASGGSSAVSGGTYLTEDSLYGWMAIHP